MMKLSKMIFIFFVVILIFSSGCINQDAKKQEEYEKCTSVCASVLEDDFVTMELCRRECKEEFLEEK